MLGPLRILLVDNLMIRRYGNLRMGPGRKLMCGAISASKSPRSPVSVADHTVQSTFV